MNALRSAPYRSVDLSSLPLFQSSVSWGVKQLSYAARRLPFYGRSLPALAVISPSLHAAVVETEGFGSICLDLRERICVPVFVYGCYRHQKPEDAILDALLRPGMKVFDIGANIGYYSAFMSRRVGNHGLVVAVEPTSRGFRLLSKNKDLCPPNLIILQAAIGPTPGRAEVQEQKSLDTSFVRFATSEEQDAVAVLTLDGLKDQYGDPDIVKIDIEGAEILALQGAVETLASTVPPFVMVEYIASNASRFGGYARSELLAYFPNDRYRVFRIAPPGILCDLDVAPIAATNDYLAVPLNFLSKVQSLIEK